MRILLLPLFFVVASCDPKPVHVTELQSAEVPAEAATPAMDQRSRLLPQGPVSRADDGGIQVRLRQPPVPAGWQQIPARASFYLLSYDLPGGVRCDVGITGGSLEENLQRWVAQIEGATLAGGTAALPAQSLAGLSGRFLELAGNYNPGMGRPAQPNTRLLGAAASDERQNTITVKMTGPDALVAAQRQAFLNFCTSLQAAE